MKTFDVVITDTKPILMHNPAGMRPAKVKSGGQSNIPLPEEEAAAGIYWMPDGSSTCTQHWSTRAPA